MRDAEILILDEPTSALDARSEHDIFQRFSENSCGKTTILITHRLGSVSMADRLLVLKDGQVIENGSNDELIKSKGCYFDLFALQAERYQSGSFRFESTRS